MNILSKLKEAVALHQGGDVEQADSIYKEIIRKSPKNVDALYLSGLIAAQKGNYPYAKELLKRAAKVGTNIPKIFNTLGFVLGELGEYQSAITSFSTAIRIDPQNPESYYNRGTVFHKSDNPEEAIKNYNKAVELDPNYLVALANRGNALQSIRQFEESLASYDQALTVNDQFPEAWSDRGNVLKELNRLEEGVESCTKAIELHPTYYQAYFNRGVILQALNRVDDAIADYDESLRLSPTFSPPRWNKGISLLTKGDFSSGVTLYETRWGLLQRESNFIQPQWQGWESIKGKTMLIHGEQGLGDNIQFVRYVQMFVDKGATVILSVAESLISILKNVNGISGIFKLGDELPEFDFHCPMGSLMASFRTTESTIPKNVPYIHPTNSSIDYWKNKLKDVENLKVGLVWSGALRKHRQDLWSENIRRNIPFSTISKLNSEGINFYSLQKGDPGESELKEQKQLYWNTDNLFNFMDDVGDFDDTAGLISQLDLIISVDTAVMHLACAMGKPVWMLNRFDTDWRWMLNRSDSPWYPSLKIFRQETNNFDWEIPVLQAREELIKVFHSHTKEKI